MRARIAIAFLVVLGCGLRAGAAEAAGGAGEVSIVSSGFIFEKAPFAECHASTIVQAREGLAAAWFGGTSEGRDDVGIWFARFDGKRWGAPVEVATGANETSKRYPCWNPVLFQPKVGGLVLFYKVGPSPSTWWGMRITSSDGGKTWSKPRRLGEGLIGPVKNKPIQLEDGAILCGSSTENKGWRIHMERTGDLGETAEKIEPKMDVQKLGVIQPTILTWGGGRMQILCRSRQQRIAESWSEDGGKTWSEMRLTDLPNPSSGIDAVTLRDGRALLVFNDTTRGRTPLSVALSADGKTWTRAAVLEDQPGEFSYPAVIQAADGRVHITYTWKRQRIKHVVVAVKPRAK